jgi:phage terminase small subunit
MSGEKRKNKETATPKIAKAKKMLTLKQARFSAALMKARTKREAAIIAGYSRKNIDQSANQAYNAILTKAPEAMGQAGLIAPGNHERHLVPLLQATEVKLAQHKGQFTDFVELEDNHDEAGGDEHGFQAAGRISAGRSSARREEYSRCHHLRYAAA